MIKSSIIAGKRAQDDMPIKVIKNDINNKSAGRREGCPKKGRLIGLDLGVKTIGVALSDGEQSIATPHSTISRTKLSADLVALADIMNEYEVRGAVLGWPLNMDGSMGPRCDNVRSFADELMQACGKDFWIGLWDERLSTQSVDDFVDSRVDMGKKSKRAAKQSGLTDKLAAQVILQGFLDF